MGAHMDPALTEADVIVLTNLLHDVDQGSSSALAADHDEQSAKLLSGMNNEKSDEFQPTVFTGWDQKDLCAYPTFNEYVLQPYISWAETVVRRPTDVVFLTHILLYFATSVPSAIYLYYNFTYIHGICHWLMQLWYAGPFTLMLHNHIHNNGVLAKEYSWFDKSFPYVLQPLMGHTWNSYYYHHVKHHHVEGNGPGDLSSTIRYQRDELLDFLKYVGRFLAIVWLELPLYFLRRGKTGLAIANFANEGVSFLSILILSRINMRATIFAFMIPLLQMRIAMMLGNWGQHAFVDEEDPKSDFRSSITLIDVSSNRHCFNDGYHTSHHLNPRRHWRDHPLSFLKAKRQYGKENALVFKDIDYLMITIKLMQKDYKHLARCLVPIGDQTGMSEQQIMDMLRTKTRKFTPADIEKKFGKQ